MRRLPATFCAVGALMLSSCAAMKGAESNVTMRLSPRFQGGETAPAPSFAVAPVQGRGLTSGLRYTYVDAVAPGEVRQAARYFWEEPPTRVVERAIVAGLRGRYGTVSGPELSVAADRRIVAALERFEEIGAGGAAQAHVAFGASVTAAGKLLRSGRYCGTAPIPDASGTGRARAFEQAIQSAVAALVQDVAATGAASATC